MVCTGFNGVGCAPEAFTPQRMIARTTNPSAIDCRKNGRACTLSPRERAGVRGNSMREQNLHSKIGIRLMSNRITTIRSLAPVTEIIEQRHAGRLGPHSHFARVLECLILPFQRLLAI